MLKAVLIFFLFLGSQALSGIIVLLWGKWFHDTGAEWSGAGSFDATALGVGLWTGNLLLLVVLWQSRLTGRVLFSALRRGIPPRSGRALSGFLLLGLALSFLIYPLDLDDGGTMARFGEMKDNLLVMTVLCVLGPAMEELVFRDGIQKHLILSGMKPWGAILTSSAVFAVVHMNAAQAVPAFLLGTLLGLLYHKTGDLRLCLPAHVINNILAFGMLHYPEMTHQLDALPGESFWAIGLPILVVGGIVFYSGLKK